MNVSEATWSQTACILCECNCGIEVQVDGRRLERIRGDRAHPGTHGYTCNKAMRLDHYQNGRDRLTAPLKRQPDGTFAEIAPYAGLTASEWTWGAIFFDADLDGYPDLLISCGNLQDYMDADAMVSRAKKMRKMEEMEDLIQILHQIILVFLITLDLIPLIIILILIIVYLLLILGIGRRILIILIVRENIIIQLMIQR